MNARPLLAALVMLALAIKLLVPPGFMPGSSLGQPVVLCPGQGPMPMMAMDHGSGHEPAKAPHHGPEHQCAFSGLSATSLAATLDGSGTDPALPVSVAVAHDRHAAAPGRGMAAPPPPSHAPPAIRA